MTSLLDFGLFSCSRLVAQTQGLQRIQMSGFGSDLSADEDASWDSEDEKETAHLGSRNTGLSLGHPSPLREFSSGCPFTVAHLIIGPLFSEFPPNYFLSWPHRTWRKTRLMIY